jgi:hypothetical protein
MKLNKPDERDLLEARNGFTIIKKTNYTESLFNQLIHERDIKPCAKYFIAGFNILSNQQEIFFQKN